MATLAYLSTLIPGTLLDVVSLWIFKTTFILACPAKLSRALRDPPRPRDRATPTSHGSTGPYRPNNRPEHLVRRAGGVQTSRPRSPIWRGIVKWWKSRHEEFCLDVSTAFFDCVYQQPLPQVLLMYSCTWCVGGWVDRPVMGGCLLMCC